MQSDLAVLCRDARARIDVPAVPLTAIRNAAGLPQTRKRTWLTALIAGISIVAVAAAATVLGTHITFEQDGKVLIEAHHLQAKFKNPTKADVDGAIRAANFTVTPPVGLPSGSRLKQLWSNSDVIVLAYDLPGAWRASHHLVLIVLAKPEAVATAVGTGKVKLLLASQGVPIHFRVGGEEVVIAMHNAMTPAELVRMKQAMLRSSR